MRDISAFELCTRARGSFFEPLPKRRRVEYATEMGEAWLGDSRQLLKKLQSESVDLVLTSPPYALVKKKEYGNSPEEQYVRWFRPFARQIFRILKPVGSFVLNIGGAWKPGFPVRSLYNYRLLLDLCDPPSNRKRAPQFYLAQDYYWLNPAKLPNPVQWVNVERIRVKDAVEPIWWLSKSPYPKANNREVLDPYSQHMEKLIRTQKYNSDPRPSGWKVSKVWGRDNGGAIPPNISTQDGLDLILNLMVESNTPSNDIFRRNLRSNGLNAHPAVFPKAIPEFFIKFLTQENDVVIDPFTGSNTTGFTADQLKRQWVAMEANAAYVEASSTRWIHQEEQDARLF